MSVNKVILIGHMGADPEVRTFQNGGRVCNLRVATSDTWKDKNTGEKRERTEWHSVAIHADHAVTFAERYLRKGSEIYIEGQLETRKWQDQSGNDRYSTEVVVRPYGGEVQGLDPKRQDDPGGRDAQHAAGYEAQRPAGGGMDDEIPFAPEFR